MNSSREISKAYREAFARANEEVEEGLSPDDMKRVNATIDRAVQQLVWGELKK